MPTKFIFVTGGVVSSLGKGISVASIGRILKSRGLTVSVIKLDPYLNVDPGTMSPYQHGEVFVTRDGGEIAGVVFGNPPQFHLFIQRHSTRQRDLRPIDATLIPLPSELTTPPVTKINFVGICLR